MCKYLSWWTSLNSTLLIVKAVFITKWHSKIYRLLLRMKKVHWRLIWLQNHQQKGYMLELYVGEINYLMSNDTLYKFFMMQFDILFAIKDGDSSTSIHYKQIGYSWLVLAADRQCGSFHKRCRHTLPWTVYRHWESQSISLLIHFFNVRYDCCTVYALYLRLERRSFTALGW